MRRGLYSLGAAVVALSILVAGCGGKSSTPAAPTPPAAPAPADAKPAADPETKELVLYSGRKENQIQPIIDLFTQQTGVKVVIKSGGAAELANLILEEKSNPKADIYLSNDAGSLERLRAEKAFATYTSANLNLVPADLRSPDNTWYAATVRIRAIMYNKSLVQESELPRNTRDLADPKWKGQIGMATGANESVIANITALRLIDGDAKTEQFLNDLKKNEVKIYKGHGDVRQAVGRGEIKLGWVNHYYFYQQLKEKENNNVGLIYPDQEIGGTTVNVSGLGIVAGAKNIGNAKKFLDFILSPEAQKIFAETNFEFPVRSDVKVATTEPLSAIKRNPVKLGQFGTEWDNTVRLIDKIGMVLR